MYFLCARFVARVLQVVQRENYLAFMEWFVYTLPEVALPVKVCIYFEVCTLRYAKNVDKKLIGGSSVSWQGWGRGRGGFCVIGAYRGDTSPIVLGATAVVVLTVFVVEFKCCGHVRCWSSIVVGKLLYSGGG